MAEDWPKIKNRRTNKLSPWMTIIERDVELAPDQPADTYYAVSQSDYVSILAMTAEGRIPIVRQFRPALEQFTWELPAGMVDDGEDPAIACTRELLEETGYTALNVHKLGVTAPCSGRLSNRLHSFFVEAAEPPAIFRPETGIEVKIISPDELVSLINSGDFVSQLHIGTIMQATLCGLIDLPRMSRT
jgi:8-oxo-dGTP pyrophosphatase MutT (NUDIX family)